MREQTQLDGCLLQAEVAYPQDSVLVCGRCPNRSDLIGNLGVACVAVPPSARTSARAEPRS